MIGDISIGKQQHGENGKFDASNNTLGTLSERLKEVHLAECLIDNYCFRCLGVYVWKDD
jgi:hypothetical protein